MGFKTRKQALQLQRDLIVAYSEPKPQRDVETQADQYGVKTVVE